jgi:hypothetical protein
MPERVATFENRDFKRKLKIISKKEKKKKKDGEFFE